MREIKSFVNDLKTFSSNAEEIINEKRFEIEADNDEQELVLQSTLRHDPYYQIAKSYLESQEE